MSEPLSLWNKTPIRQAILDFVTAVRNWQVISMQEDFLQVFPFE